MGVRLKVPSRQASSGRRGSAETVRYRSLRSMPFAGVARWAAAAGRAHLVALVALLPGRPRWDAGPTVLRVVRSSERSAQLPASFVGCVLSLTGPFCGLRYCCVCGFGRVHSWGTWFFGITLRGETHALRSMLSRCLGTVRGSALTSRRWVGLTCALRGEREVSQVFVLRGRHEVSINCPSGGGRSARRPFALRSEREV